MSKDLFEILFFDLDKNTFIEPDEQIFEKENPNWNPFETVNTLGKKEVRLKINGIEKRIIETIYLEDKNKITLKFQDTHESIYKKY